MFTFNRAFANEGDNMTCYKMPETIGSYNSGRWLALLAVIIFATHSNRKTQITLYIAQE